MKARLAFLFLLIGALVSVCLSDTSGGHSRKTLPSEHQGSLSSKNATATATSSSSSNHRHANSTGGEAEIKKKKKKKKNRGKKNGKKHGKKGNSKEEEKSIHIDIPKIVVVTNETKVFPCMSPERKEQVEGIVTGWVMARKIGIWDALSLRRLSPSESKKKLYALMEEKGLPDFPPCLNVTQNATATPAVVYEDAEEIEEELSSNTDEDVSGTFGEDDSDIFGDDDDDDESFGGEEGNEVCPEDHRLSKKLQTLENMLSLKQKSSASFLNQLISEERSRYAEPCMDEIREVLLKYNVSTIALDVTTADVSRSLMPPADPRLRECLQQLVSTADGIAKLEAAVKMGGKVTAKRIDWQAVHVQDKMVAVMEKNDVLVQLLCDQEKTEDTKSAPGAEMTAEELEEGIAKLTMAIEKGYLPLDTFDKLFSGEIDKEWLMNNLTQNRDFVIDQLPEKLATMAREGRLDEKYIQLFISGKSRSEIEEILVQDDSFFRLMFPDMFVQALGNKPFPMWLKRTAFGPNASSLPKIIFSNSSLCDDLFGASSCAFLSLYSDPTNKAMAQALNYLIYGCLLCIMVAMGLTIEYSKVLELAKRPKGVLIAFVAQFGFMPAAAYVLTQVFELEVYSAIAILLNGCAPGGNVSNILAYALDGDMNLSILMTCCSCIIGLGMMPLNVYLWSQFVAPADSNTVIPYKNICLSIVVTILPVIYGSLIRNYKPKYVKITKNVSFFIVTIISFGVTVITWKLFGDILFSFFPTELIAVCAILPAVGYTFGYLVSWIFREDHKRCRTIMIETGCQNSQLCASILKLSFNPVKIGILFLVPMVYMLLQIIEAMFMVFLWKCYKRWRGNGYEIQEQKDDDDCDEKKMAIEMKFSSNSSSPSSEKKSEDFNSEKRPKSILRDISEVWPLDGKPSDACLTSFQQAESEKMV